MALASGVPLVGYLLTASAHGYWLDAGEFIAASVNLGISHPPGQPLAAILGRLFAMLPLGPLSLRVALASAALAACAAAALFCAVQTTVAAVGEKREWVSVPLAVGATWYVAGSFSWWFQAVRPEVYALQAALVCLAVERAIALEAAWPTRDARPLLVAALALGLGLANHHFLAVLALPALLPVTVRVLQSRGLKPIAQSCAAGLLGLAVYLYLPLRAASHPLPNLGEPDTWSRFFWVVSAQTFHKNVGGGAPQPMSERYADVAVVLWNDLFLCLIIALGGLYILLRTPGARRIGTIWMLLLGSNAVARAWLGFIRSNPDAMGYLLPSFAALAALFAAFVAALLAPLGGRESPGALVLTEEKTLLELSIGILTTPAQRRSAAVFLVVVLVAALGMAQIYRTAARASLAGFDARDDFDDLGRRELPPRAILLAHEPGTIFSHWGGQGEDGLRPDVKLVPVPFLSYPAMVDRLIKEKPELRDLLREHLLYGELGPEALQSLASRRPLLLEMDVRLRQNIYRTMVPSGLFYRVLPGGATDLDERAGARSQRAAYRRLYRRIGPGRKEPATRARLLWRHFTDALYYMGYGDLAAARATLRMARKIEPADKVLNAMEEALQDKGLKGAVDVTPFVKKLQ
jgi:hypothetical protein